MNTYEIAGDDRKYVLHTDHLAAIAALEGENAKLREEVAAFREGMPDKKLFDAALHCLDMQVKLWSGPGPYVVVPWSSPPSAMYGDYAPSLGAVCQWLRSIASKGGG